MGRTRSKREHREFGTTSAEEDGGSCGSEDNPCKLEGVVADCSEPNEDCGNEGDDEDEWDEDMCDEDWGDGACDDWWGDDPCEDCTGGGGGPDPGSGEDCDPNAIDEGCEDTWNLKNPPIAPDHEDLEDIEDPECPAAPDAHWAVIAWCDGDSPNQTETALLVEAFAAMDQLGDSHCRAVAEHGREHFDSFRLFGPSMSLGTGAAPIGGDWVVLNRAAFEVAQSTNDRWIVDDGKGRTIVDLAWILAHEIGHMMGETHVVHDGEELEWRTPSAERCGVSDLG